MKLLANLFVKYPDLNGNIIFGDVLKKDRIDVSVTVSNDGGHNAEVITIQDANNLSLEIIKKQIDENLEKIQHGFDVNLRKKKFFLNLLPTFLLGPFLRIISILSASGINLSILGLPKYSYGAAVICNYGKEGLEDTFLPLFPFLNIFICLLFPPILDNSSNFSLSFLFIKNKFTLFVLFSGTVFLNSFKSFGLF